MCFSVCVYPLDTLFIDTDALVQSFKDLAQSESKESNGAKLQTVSHFLQDGWRLLRDFIRSSSCLSGNLAN